MSSPHTIFPDGTHIGLGNSVDLAIYHDSANSYLSQNGTGSLILQHAVADGDIIFKADDGTGTVTPYITLDGGATNVLFSVDTMLNGGGNYIQVDVSDDSLKFADNAKIKLGTGLDLQIYHDGSNSYIDDTGTGNLYVRGDAQILLSAPSGGEVYAKFIKDGACEFRHNDSKKLETTAAGVAVTGILGVGATSPGTINSVAFSSVGLHTNSGTLGRTITEGSNSAEFIANDSGASANERAKFFNSDSGVLSIGKYADNGTATAQLSISNGGDATFVGSVTPALGVTKPIASAAANVAAAVAGSIYTFSDADGAIVTLPDSGGGGLVGQTFEFVCTATATSNSHKVIFSDTTNEKFIGRLTAIDTDTDNTQLVYVPGNSKQSYSYEWYYYRYYW